MTAADWVSPPGITAADSADDGVLHLATPHGLVTVRKERSYLLNRDARLHGYPVAHTLDAEYGLTSIHGILLDDDPIALFGKDGGATGVHAHSALWLDERLYLAIGNAVVCMTLRPYALLWSLEVDWATCFGVHFHPETDALLAHGELQITRFTPQGQILWQASGRDIFTGSFSLGLQHVEVVDFYNDIYRFRYDNGQWVPGADPT
jgi:hypothetical protein